MRLTPRAGPPRTAALCTRTRRTPLGNPPRQPARRKKCILKTMIILSNSIDNYGYSINNSNDIIIILIIVR